MAERGSEGCGCLIVLAVAAFAFHQCTSARDHIAAPSYDDGRYEDARADAAANLSGTTYEEFNGSGACTEDCGGHNAGWEWADQNGVTDASECGGSGSFYDGCSAYADQLEAEATDNDH